MRNSLTIFFFLLTYWSAAQTAEKRYKFAQTYFGMEWNYMPNYPTGIFLNDNGNLDNFDRSAFLTPSVTIGGTHFWGFTDFYVSASTRNINLKQRTINTPSVYNDLSVMTGLKIYPLALHNKTIRPYVGYKFSPITYEQSTVDQAPAQVTKVKSMVDIGVGFTNKSLYIYAGYTRIINPNYLFPLSKTRFEEVSIAPHFISLGINYKIETSKPIIENPANQRLHEQLLVSNKLGFFIGLGPSSAFPARNSSYITNHRPYLDHRAMPLIFPDVALGYHFSKTDLNVALAYRMYFQNRQAFDVKQNILRNSIILETYKFVGDFHGFCPFFGGGISYENIKFKESENDIEQTNFTTHQVTPIITFGWDIRPSRRGDWWLLRTNLRYAPFLNINYLGENVSLQHIEFNFIQFVMYPQRLAEKRKLSKNRTITY